MYLLESPRRGYFNRYQKRLFFLMNDMGQSMKKLHDPLISMQTELTLHV